MPERIADPGAVDEDSLWELRYAGHCVSLVAGGMIT